jgi:hypothetical protein
LERVERALAAIATTEDPVEAAAVLACRAARAQGFTEGNERTALLLARWPSIATASTPRSSSRPRAGGSLTSSFSPRPVTTSRITPSPS